MISSGVVREKKQFRTFECLGFASVAGGAREEGRGGRIGREKYIYILKGKVVRRKREKSSGLWSVTGRLIVKRFGKTSGFSTFPSTPSTPTLCLRNLAEVLRPSLMPIPKLRRLRRLRRT